MQSIANYIGGELLPPATGRYIDNVEPATGRVYSRVPDSGAADVDRAASAAKAAVDSWSHTPAAERSQIMFRLADLIERDLEPLARAESIDNGKPIALARTVDIPRAAANFRFFAGAILHWRSEVHVKDYEALNYTLRRPVGVVGCISPWNLPLYLFTWKIAPALAVGNCVVGKPSEVTPMTAFMLSELCIEAGLPPGVLNIVHGAGPSAGQCVIEHPEIRGISFTGGSATGERIARVAGPMLKKVSLELGGKNPNIIFGDAEYDAALATAVKAAFTNQGEICLCGSRIFVQGPIYDRFIDDFVATTAKLKQGDPLEEDTEQGAIVSKPHFEKVIACIERAKIEGGKVLCGGAATPRGALPDRCQGGYFIQPTVITGLDHLCATNQEEIFGPVVTVQPFDEEDEVVEMANSTRYGLAATIWTQDVSRAHRVAERIESGVIWVNCWLRRDLRTPFGGMKHSGVGREGGEEALRFFTEAKNVCVAVGTAVR